MTMTKKDVEELLFSIYDDPDVTLAKLKIMYKDSIPDMPQNRTERGMAIYGKLKEIFIKEQITPQSFPDDKCLSRHIRHFLSLL